MLFQLIPIGQNSKLERAYERALDAVDADRLTEMKITESWYWAGIGNGYVVEVEGIGVRRVAR